MQYSPIGIFDSGYGGLSILKEIKEKLPQYDYLYLGDNARSPYGNRSFEIVYEFTLEAVKYLFDHGCKLVILACNTASAKALRSIQQNDLPEIDPNRRVLGVIHPTVELLGKVSKNGMIGVLGTPGTIDSESYSMEIDKLYPDFDTVGQACPMWVPLVENMEYDSPGADYFVQKYINELMEKNEDIDTIILACTHYPLLIDKINKYVPEGVNVISQGPIVADSLADYLTRHPEMDSECSKGGSVRYLTTENPLKFEKQASIFLGDKVKAHQIELEY